MRSTRSATEIEGTGSDSLAWLESSGAFGAFVLTAGRRIGWANALCRRWLTAGSDVDVLGTRLEDWLPRSADRARLAGLSGIADPGIVDLELGPADGTRVPVTGELFQMTGADGEACIAGLFQDATQYRQLLSGMERSARLEALGSLTSGVAHDFNNLLTILVGNLALVAEELRDKPKPFAKLKAARDAARRGGDLIGQLLAFARQEPVASEPLDPARVIHRIAPLIERALGRRIALRLELDDPVPPILGNSAQLESVIVNLAVNARDAIDGKGDVRIRVARAAAGTSTSTVRPRSPEPRVLIEVTDDGCGIPEEIADRIFEPFFTTKAEGSGSGLGLGMVRSYVEQFAGSVEVDSREGEGTTIRLAFPMTAATVEDSAAMTMPMTALPTGDEEVVLLVAEDNLGAMMQQILSVLGYRCRIAKDLGAARRLLSGSVPDLVVSDGFELALLLESSGAGRRPSVLMLKALGDDNTVDGPVLHKPFSLPDLATAVRRALDSEARPDAPAL